jgi:hypothetical protein
MTIDYHVYDLQKKLVMAIITSDIFNFLTLILREIKTLKSKVNKMDTRLRRCYNNPKLESETQEKQHQEFD